MIQIYIDNNNVFDYELINVWKEEIKPFILRKYPMVKEGLFNVNSDLNFLIQNIDSLKVKYEEKMEKIETKMT